MSDQTKRLELNFNDLDTHEIQILERGIDIIKHALDHYREGKIGQDLFEHFEQTIDCIKAETNGLKPLYSSNKTLQ